MAHLDNHREAKKVLKVGLGEVKQLDAMPTEAEEVHGPADDLAHEGL